MGFVDDQVGGLIASAGNPGVTVRGAPVGGFAGLGPEQLSSPGPFGDLGSLVLGYDRLDLGEQPSLGIRSDIGHVEIADGDTVAGQFVGDQHLIGVGAAEPIGGEAPDGVDQTSLCRVAERVETRAVQPGSGDSVVDELADQSGVLGGDALS